LWSVFIVFLSLNGQIHRLADWTINGNTWINISLIEKAAYIKGYNDGTQMGVISTYRGLNAGRVLYKVFSDEEIAKYEDALTETLCTVSFTSEQIVGGIDELYKDFANQSIPVPLIIPVVGRRLRGELGIDGLEKELQELRKTVVEKLKTKIPELTAH
jgi:hypothetical protein